MKILKLVGIISLAATSTIMCTVNDYKLYLHKLDSVCKSHTAHSNDKAFKEDLAKLLANYGLIFRETVQEVEDFAQDSDAAGDEIEEVQTLFVAKTLRSGQEIVYKGSVVITGDVNPGAEVTAGGDVIIRGTCRGVVHAGAYGNSKATITANRLVASQLRIANLISRAPDHLDKPEYIETARIQDGNVIIEKVDI